jgi:ketosteroid isomerase-like protein
MAEHANVEAARDAYEAFSKGDFERTSSFWTDNIVLHIGGHHPLAGDYRGKQEFINLATRLGELTSGTLNQEIQDLVGNDRHVVALIAERAERNGKSHSMEATHVWRMENGKGAEAWVYPWDQQAEDAFWS